MKIEMTDGRTLCGSFMCTDRDNNIILGSCTEHLQPDGNSLHIFTIYRFPCLLVATFVFSVFQPFNLTTWLVLFYYIVISELTGICNDFLFYCF